MPRKSEQLTERERARIRKLYEEGLGSARQVAEAWNARSDVRVSRSLVAKIVRGCARPRPVWNLKAKLKREGHHAPRAATGRPGGAKVLTR
jgi:hypothetical protein